MHCRIIGYTNIKDSDQTAHLRISDVNISIKDPGGGGWLRGRDGGGRELQTIL